MSGSAISWRRIQKLNRDRGERFVHAWTYEHGVWVCIRHDGSTAEVDVVGGTTREDPAHNSTTVDLLRTRSPRTPQDASWLAELDERATALTPQEGTHAQRAALAPQEGTDE